MQMTSRDVRFGAWSWWQGGVLTATSTPVFVSALEPSSWVPACAASRPDGSGSWLRTTLSNMISGLILGDF